MQHSSIAPPISDFDFSNYFVARMPFLPKISTPLLRICKYFLVPLVNIFLSPSAVFDDDSSRATNGRVRAYGMVPVWNLSRDRTRLLSDGRRKSRFGIARYMQPVFPNRMSRRRGTCEASPLDSIRAPVCRFMYSPCSPSPAGVAHSVPCGRSGARRT